MSIKHPLATEFQEQCAFIELLQWKYKEVWEMTAAVPNGGWLANAGRSWRRLEAQGARKGYPDILIDYPIHGFHGARIEMKRKGEVPTPEQKEWLQNLSMKGYYCGICYSCDEAESFLVGYLTWSAISGTKPMLKLKK